MIGRYEYLKNYLSGCEEESPYHAWACTHEPLLSPSIFSLKGRRLNNFCVGSDPEFALTFYEGGVAVDRRPAVDAGLRVGLAAGADQNERLVELRPWPSPSVVEHVAGILAALRWMYRVYPRARALGWRAGAFFAGDGMGGHVHFGRKRPTRAVEVAALDGLARVFKASRLFPNDEWKRRMAGDHLRQIYGAPGDFRIQKHGYEYRSLPSWLLSPATAFIAIASSKLAVLDPTITTSWNSRIDMNRSRSLLRGLAKLYKSRDDDAYILYHLLTRNGDTEFERDHSQDFQANWGFDGQPVSTEESKYILPACIKPDASEVDEIQDHLLYATPLKFRSLTPKFRTNIPKGYAWLPSVFNPSRRSGFGDLLHNLVAHTELLFTLDHVREGTFVVTGPLVNMWTPDQRKFIHDYGGRTGTVGAATTVVVTAQLCQTMAIGGLRAVLLHSGLFPLWTVDTVQEDSYYKWEASMKRPTSWRKV